MIPASAIIKVAPAAVRYAGELVQQMASAGIQANIKRASMFLGQIHEESGGFTAVVESLSYRADSAMMGKFISWGRLTAAEAQKFGKTAAHPADQQALGNLLYGGAFGKKQLGNTQPGDGWKFRGRGLKQLTGRDNYRRFSQSWLGDESLLDTPERVAAPDGAVASAIWFWANKKLNAEADRGTVASVTLIVNGGATGLKNREKWTRLYAAGWVDSADFSDVHSRVL